MSIDAALLKCFVATQGSQQDGAMQNTGSSSIRAADLPETAAQNEKKKKHLLASHKAAQDLIL